MYLCEKTINMDIQSRKIAFVQEFLNVQNEDLLAYLEKILDEGKKLLLKDKVQPMTIEEFYKRIDQSMKDAKNGRLTEVNILMEEILKLKILKITLYLFLSVLEKRMALISKF